MLCESIQPLKSRILESCFNLNFILPLLNQDDSTDPFSFNFFSLFAMSGAISSYQLASTCDSVWLGLKESKEHIQYENYFDTTQINDPSFTKCRY